MKKIFIIIFIAFIPQAFAENIPTSDADILSYQKYLDSAKTYCDNSSRVWGEDNTLRPIPQYPELTEWAANQQISRLQNINTVSEEEKSRILKEISPEIIGNFSGFKTLEVARIQYRTTMNSIFSCAIIDSRLRILEDVRKKINEVVPSVNSEINSQLDREKLRLEQEKNNIQCNISSADEKPKILKQIKNSSTRQYCHYRYYLSYLEENLEADRSLIENLENSIGNAEKQKNSQTSYDWIENYNRYKTDLEREINRADTTLPRVMRTFMDMEKVYPAHLLLTIIYDDYIRLRNNLSTYMNASTQTYLKAYNAQDANNR